jgi:hypothetical protein
MRPNYAVYCFPAEYKKHPLRDLILIVQMYDPVAFASILSDFLSLSTDIHSHMHNIVPNMMDAPQYL